MPTDTPEQELIKVADLIVGLRNTLTERQRDLDLASKAIKDRDATLAEKNEQIGNLTAELEALRRGVDAYRLASSKDSDSVRQWEDAVGSLIWPLKLSTVVCHPQQPWHDGEIPDVLVSVPGIEWEIERKSNDKVTATGIIAGKNPEVRCRPINASWEDVCRAAAIILGNVHCMQGVARMKDAIVFETLGIDKSSKASSRACAEYHKAYSLAVEFLRPAAVTVAAVTRADLEGFRREYLKPLFEAPESRPFGFLQADTAWQDASETGAAGYYRGRRAAFSEVERHIKKLFGMLGHEAKVSKADGT